MFSKPFTVHSSQKNNWEKVASSSDRIQFIDPESIKYKKGKLYVSAKVSNINTDTQVILNSKEYGMEIDCEKRLFKEQGEKWASSVGNKLITETIIKSCTY